MDTLFEEKGRGMMGLVRRKKTSRSTGWLRMKQCLVSQSGMTLIEVMAALTLMLIVFTGFVMMTTASSQMNRKAEEMRSRYESQLEDITREKNLTNSTEILTLKVAGNAGSRNVKVNILVKTAKGSGALAIFEKNETM